MKLASCFCVLLIVTVLAASTVLAAPVLTNGDRWPFGSPRAVTVGGGYVYMARGNVLTILNSSLIAQSTIDLGAEIRCICYSDNYIFAAMGSKGLILVNVTDPTDPQKQDTFTPDDDSSVGSVFVSDDYAYIANIGNQFKIVKVSTLAEVGSVSVPGLLVSAVNVYVYDDVAAVVDQVNGLHLIDVTTKSSPQWESVTAIAGAFDVRLNGSYAYVASISGGLDIVDYGDTGSNENPQMRGSYTPTDGYSVGVFVSGTTAWLADQVNGLHVINVLDKDNPSGTPSGTDGAYSVAYDGSDVFVCDYEYGLRKMDATPTAYDLPANAQSLFVDDNDYLYVVDSAASNEGLRVLDAYYPGSIGYKSFAETTGQAYDVFVDGTFAYVADGDQGLQIVDVSDKNDPEAPIRVDTDGTAYGVFVSGDYAYVADGTYGLQIIDVSDKDNLGAPIRVDTDGTAYGVFVSGGYAYVASGSAGLYIVALSDNSTSQVVTGGTAYDVFVSGTYAYVACGTAGLYIIDLSDNSTVQVDTDGTAYDVFVSGNYAYIADGTNGLVTVDVSDPTDPSEVEEWSTGTTAEALGVDVVGEYVYVAEGLGGAAIYRLTDKDPFVPTTPPDSGGGGGCFITNLGF
jgi:hypothetical protein